MKIKSPAAESRNTFSILPDRTFSILIVCLGNICRSPIAEAFLKREFERANCNLKFSVSSAGFLHSGQPASQPAEIIMMKRGLDLSHHLSRKITRKLVSAQDLILTMEEEQKERIKEMNESRPVIDSIISFASQGTVKGDVKDPYGLPTRVYEEVADELEILCRKIASQLLKKQTA